MGLILDRLSMQISSVRRLPPIEAAGLGFVAAGITILFAGGPWGAIVVVLGLVPLAVLDPWHYLVTAAAILPLTVVGWTSPLLGDSFAGFDARSLLIVALGVIGLFVSARSFSQRLWPRTLAFGVEWVGVAFLLYRILDGVVSSDGFGTWAIPALRWAAYLSAFSIAHAYAPPGRGSRSLGYAAIAGFAISSAIAVGLFLAGGANLQNGAIRATGLGNAGPVAVAFAGQMALLLGFFTIVNGDKKKAIGGWVSALLGGLAIVASATRLVLGTAVLGLAIPLMLLRSWRPLAALGVLVLVVLIARPDLAGRFGQAIDQTVGGGQTSGEGSAISDDAAVCNDPAPGPDASLRFRFFIWNRLLDAWSHDPLLGIGPGMTPRVITCAQNVVPHNSYIGALAELGLIGLAFFVGLQLLVIWLLWRRALGRSLAERVATPEFAAIVIFVAFNVLGVLNNPGLFLDVQIVIWGLVGAALVSDRSARTEVASAG